MTMYIVLKKATIFIYNSRKDYIHYPQKPKVFFNIMNCSFLKSRNLLIISDIIYKQEIH